MENTFEKECAAIAEGFDKVSTALKQCISNIDELLDSEIREAQEAERTAFELVGRAQLLLAEAERDLCKTREAQKLLRNAEALLRHTYFPSDDDEDSWASENRSRADLVAQMLHRACVLERFCK
ncbi:MAG: hypothetical protein MR637_00135 [Clostridiales bacterium]|nr:hypothetical protein [Clostridiales bacterium]